MKALLATIFLLINSIQPIGWTLDCHFYDKEKDVSSSESSKIVNLTGVVTVDRLYLVQVTVYINSSVDLGWNTSVFPPTMTFNSSSSKEFTVFVEVPPNIENRTATVTVRAKAEGGGIEKIDEDVSYIKVMTSQINKTTNTTFAPPNYKVGVNRTPIFVIVFICVMAVPAILVAYYKIIRRMFRRKSRKKK